MSRRHLILFVIALVVAGGIGFVAARLLDHGRQEEHAGEHAPHAKEDAHVEGKSDAGFLALKESEAASAGVQIVSVERGGGSEILLPGRVSLAPNAQATIGAPLSGMVTQFHVATGSKVTAGAPIATLRSPEAARVKASLDAAVASVEAANAAEKRERDLHQAGVVARQDWEAARATSLKAQADLRAAQAHTAALGSPRADGVTTIRTPLTGIVTRISAAPGTVLAAGADVAEVVDPSRIELVFDAPAATSSLVVVGATLEVRHPDGQNTSATVTAVAPGLAGRGNATVRARPSGPPLPPGTVVSGRLAGKGQGALVVPSDAVQTVEGKPSVFVADGQGFRATPVLPGQAAFGKTEILRGLTGSERIAGTGAFLLKAQLAKGEAAHGH